MFFDRVKFKTMAKEQIRGNIGILFVCSLIFALILGGCGLIPVIGVAVSGIIAPAFTLSFVMIYLALTEGVKPQVGDIFKGFEYFGKVLWLSILIDFFTFLWSLLFVIPGIVKSYAYSMAFYILAENPDMTAREALNESKKITQGHKMDLFVLQLSFFWWALLCVVTFGIAGIYVLPYTITTLTNAYKALKSKSDGSNNEPAEPETPQ